MSRDYVETDTSYYSDAHEDAMAGIPRGTYRSDTQRALSVLSTPELEQLAYELAVGSVSDRAFLMWELNPVLLGRWERD